MENIDMICEKLVKLKKKNNSETYVSCEFLLKINDEIFDMENDEKYLIKIRDRLSETYFKYIEKLCPEGSTIVVKLSGLHFDFVDFLKNYTFSKDSRNHIISHYHHWKIDDSEGIDEDTYVLIKCDKRLFKELYDLYWFSINVEYHFEGIILNPDDVMYVEKWCRLDENKDKMDSLINKAVLIFDNLYNGFHFQIITDKKKTDYFKNCKLKENGAGS